MTQALQHLIAEARAIASNDDAVLFKGRYWVTDGGRACPLQWDDCGQPVFKDRSSDIYDYGEKGGPGDHECKHHCPHNGQKPPYFQVSNYDN